MPTKTIPGFDEKHYLAFPPLSKLSCIKEETLREVLGHCGLAIHRKNTGYSPLLKEWQYFLAEQEIPEVEVTHLALGKKKGYYIRLRSWNKGLNYAPKTPGELWLAAL